LKNGIEGSLQYMSGVFPQMTPKYDELLTKKYMDVYIECTNP